MFGNFTKVLEGQRTSCQGNAYFCKPDVPKMYSILRLNFVAVNVSLLEVLVLPDSMDLYNLFGHKTLDYWRPYLLVSFNCLYPVIDSLS